ncbi:uncharacterized protein K452DRAFT_304978 [Aplosporella prunicola CBS 121167]|uniref:Ecp2 effector protein domain-containing protein n=1 Tax=Aplosporella prunicola CBS 121167 TaxID=1176127 RepID=A0A6A6BPB6_9PEZI|nr:uncharacterized protein K452DRAFT_304978 [Aplosporella prunicola CBS 121167]KAF2145979.1 hypothetical protein K452DRAFT_304978 [Aplosporella prunicola CBS 121167]
MHLPTALLLALAAALTSSSPLPYPSPLPLPSPSPIALPKTFPNFHYGATCDAGKGSPKTQDVTGAINRARGHSGQACRVNNSMGSDCTTWARAGSATISVCGEFKETLDCADMARFANEIQQLCVLQGTDLIGGVFYVSPRLAVVVSNKNQ